MKNPVLITALALLGLATACGRKTAASWEQFPAPLKERLEKQLPGDTLTELKSFLVARNDPGMNEIVVSGDTDLQIYYISQLLSANAGVLADARSLAEAEAGFKLSVAVNPGNHGAYQNFGGNAGMALLLHNTGRKAEASPYAKKAVAQLELHDSQRRTLSNGSALEKRMIKLIDDGASIKPEQEAALRKLMADLAK